MPETMQAILKATPSPAVTRDTVPVPKPGPADILARVRATSICGTDVHIYRWDDWAAHRLHPPLIVGHEFTGEIVDVGKNVQGLKAGDFIAAESHVVCGHCRACREGNYHVCENTKILGVDRDGCFADYVAIPAVNAWKVAADVPPTIATLMEPVGNAVFVVTEGNVAGKFVAVMGCGPAGLAAIAVAKAMGAAWVLAFDLKAERRALALKMGADVAIDPTARDPRESLPWPVPAGGVDVVLEMSGSNAAIRQGLRMLRTEGRLIAFGLPGKEINLDWSEELVFKGITIRAVVGRRLWQTWYQLQALLDSGRLDLRPLVTHQFKLSDFDKGMAAMMQGDSGKVVFLNE